MWGSYLKWCGHIIENTVGSKGETFRFGSNEYVVLINSDEKKKVAQIAAKIQKNFLLADEEKPDVLQPVTASVGIAFYPDTASGADELLSQAERANFYAKRDGKTVLKFMEHIQKMNLRISRYKSIMNRLHQRFTH